MTAIDDDDKARMENADVKLLGITVSKLLAIDNLELVMPPRSRPRQFLENMDQRLNVFHGMPSRFDVQGIKDLAWKFRRQLPAHLAPKLPPHDPIVQEMEGL